MINVLQAGRFIAAMAVVFHHAVISVTAFVGSPPDFVQAALNYGYLGVDFFFVLSGFIIHYTMQKFPRPAGRFAYDRITRIMLPYLPVGLALAVAYTLLPSLSDSGRGWGWVSTVFLFPTDLPPALSVAWTLQHELAFYLIYAALFFTRGLRLGLLVWVSWITVAQFLRDPSTPLLRLLLEPINIEFVAGIAAAGVFLSGRSISGLGSSLLSAAMLLAFVWTGADRSESWLVGFAIAAVLPWLCAQEATGRFAIPRWLVWGGAASYAIYLLHNPLLSLTSRAMGAAAIGWGPALVASAVLSAAAGWAYHVAWEKPAMKVSRLRRGQGAAAAA